MTGPLIAVHGGAGTPRPADRDATRMAALVRSLRAGHERLAAGAAALEAVVVAVEVLEADGDFNAGRGSTPTTSGAVEMDAAVADGARRRYGAVAAIGGVCHPVAVARAVLDDGRHVLLAGAGAEAFSRQSGLDFAPEGWFTDRGSTGDTVGAVALDGAGHLAAATSTGGRRGQLPGRVGDSPVPGAGIWADDATGAVSATGIGEAFLRVAFAHEVDALVRLGSLSLEDACRQALDQVCQVGGSGGCIALDRHGRLTMPFTSPVMARGYADASGVIQAGLGPHLTVVAP